jgi:hypothetical protein
LEKIWKIYSEVFFQKTHSEILILGRKKEDWRFRDIKETWSGKRNFLTTMTIRPIKTGFSRFTGNGDQQNCCGNKN